MSLLDIYPLIHVRFPVESMHTPNFIEITRHPYEEPYHVHVEATFANEDTSGRCDFYANADCFTEWAAAFEAFPRHAQDTYLWEIGSERPEDRFAYYVRLRAFTTDSVGHCALQIRFNNNRELPHKQLFEFCIPCEAAHLNRLGKLLRTFGELKHSSLIWSKEKSELNV